MKTTEYAIIVAGGKGSRIGSEVPKQFLPVAGKPVIIHTLEAFASYSASLRTILVLPADQLSLWQKISGEWPHPLKNIEVVEGGESRWQSVRNGLAAIAGDGIVAIHDGVRPLVSSTIIGESFRTAGKLGSAVAAVPLKDSIRRMEGDDSFAENRASFRIIQTPQTFRVASLRQAYALPEDAALTDDASVAERAGMKIHLFNGSYENIKITTPEDLRFAEALLNARRRL